MKIAVRWLIVVLCCLYWAVTVQAQEENKPATAKATITGTTEDSPVSGVVTFTEKEDGVDVIANVSNVTPPGKHGIHIHAGGSCGDGGKAAGGHYNPDMVDHGFLPTDGLEKAHAGDMGNIEIDEKGQGLLVLFLPGLRLTGDKYNIVGHTVILHEKEDDFSQPTGNAGGRIGCGTINLTN